LERRRTSQSRARAPEQRSTAGDGTPGRLLLTVLLLICATVLAAAVGFLLFVLREAPGEPGDPPVTVIIERGWGLTRIARTLEDAEVIADYRGFILVAKQYGVANRLRAGEYAISRGLPLRDVLDQIANGRTVLHRFTVLPGETAFTVAAKLQRAGLDEKNAADNLVTDPVFCKRLGVPARRLEGYLYPETYTYQRGANANELLTMMVEQFFKVWNEKFAARTLEQKMTVHDVVTLASIVEKETAYDPERPKIARAFLNRLRIGMRLQADPTVIYSLGRHFNGNLSHAHLRQDHPYNTYTRKGLPPGPIANPGAESMEAVLWPAEGKWKYFVSTNRGHHVFSETYKQHVNAVNKYQR